MASVCVRAMRRGGERIAYGNVDMGADEFYPHLYRMGAADMPRVGFETRLRALVADAREPGSWQGCFDFERRW